MFNWLKENLPWCLTGLAAVAYFLGTSGLLIFTYLIGRSDVFIQSLEFGQNLVVLALSSLLFFIIYAGALLFIPNVIPCLLYREIIKRKEKMEATGEGMEQVMRWTFRMLVIGALGMVLALALIKSEVAGVAPNHWWWVLGCIFLPTILAFLWFFYKNVAWVSGQGNSFKVCLMSIVILVVASALSVWLPLAYLAVHGNGKLEDWSEFFILLIFSISLMYISYSYYVRKKEDSDRRYWREGFLC